MTTPRGFITSALHLGRHLNEVGDLGSIKRSLMIGSSHQEILEAASFCTEVQAHNISDENSAEHGSVIVKAPTWIKERIRVRGDMHHWDWLDILGFGERDLISLNEASLRWSDVETASLLDGLFDRLSPRGRLHVRTALARWCRPWDSHLINLYRSSPGIIFAENLRASSSGEISGEMAFCNGRYDLANLDEFFENVSNNLELKIRSDGCATRNGHLNKWLRDQEAAGHIVLSMVLVDDDGWHSQYHVLTVKTEALRERLKKSPISMSEHVVGLYQAHSAIVRTCDL